MNYLNMNEARVSLSEVVGRAAFGGERVILARHNKPIAAVVSLRDVEMLRWMEEQAKRERSEE
jgi:prevent-host-death family protein